MMNRPTTYYFFKNCFTLFVTVLCYSLGTSQAVTIYSENIGTVTSTTLVNSYTGWQNGSPISYNSPSTGQADVRNSLSSSGYSGASGSGNVFFGTSASNGNERIFIISGINTSAYNNLELSFGFYRTNSTNTMDVEVSEDGINYSPLSFTPSVNSWSLITASGTIPSTPNLRIRFRKDNSTQFRIDDIVLKGDIASQDTRVTFAQNDVTVNEGDGTYNLSLNIVNPSSTNATTADVVLTSGDPADINNYTTQVVNFPAGSSMAVTVPITITDDNLIEGLETLSFTIQNVQGGSNAVVGLTPNFDLSIEDNDFPTIINFNPTSLEVNEADGSVSISVSINMASSTSTTAEISLTSGNAGDIGNYTTQSITFPSNSAADQTITVNITNDNNLEGYEEFEFSIVNVMGGLMAMAGTDNVFTLGINDDDLPTALDIRINEVDANTLGTDDKEFIELYSPNGGNYSLDNLVLVLFNGSNDLSYAAWDLDGYVTDANGYFIIGSSILTSVSPEITFGTNVVQNGADAVALYYADDSDFPGSTPVTGRDLIDALVYGNNNSDDLGLLNALNQTEQINEDVNGLSDTESIQRGSWFVAGPTPRAMNSLPIRLQSLKATQQGKDNIIQWVTAEEINNDKFEILHALDNGTYQVIGTVKGAGNTSVGDNYSFRHRDAAFGTHYYQIRQIDFDGKSELYGPVAVNVGNKDRLEIYPYMTDGMLYVAGNTTLDAKYTISNTQGQLVRIGAMANTIDVSNLASGMYIFQSGNEVAKFVKL